MRRRETPAFLMSLAKAAKTAKEDPLLACGSRIVRNPRIRVIFWKNRRAARRFYALAVQITQESCFVFCYLRSSAFICGQIMLFLACIIRQRVSQLLSRAP